MAKRKRARPTHGLWGDMGPTDLPRVCSICSAQLRLHVRPHAKDAPEVNLWTEEHGYLEVLVHYCPVCDPHVAEARRCT